jgi:hypothetical protein
MAEAFVNDGNFQCAFLTGLEKVVFARSGQVKLSEVASILIKHQIPKLFQSVEDIGVPKEVSSEARLWWGIMR